MRMPFQSFSFVWTPGFVRTGEPLHIQHEKQLRNGNVAASVTSASGPGCCTLFQQLGGEEMSKIKLTWRKNQSPFPHQNSVSSYKTCN